MNGGWLKIAQLSWGAALFLVAARAFSADQGREVAGEKRTQENMVSADAMFAF